MVKTNTLENKLLLAAVTTDAKTQVELILANSADVIDWSVLIEKALAHHVTGLLCKVLLDTAETLVPEAIKLACQQKLVLQRSANQAAVQQLLLLIAKLNAKGIEVVPFKGVTLAIDSYQDIALRSFRDLDFMIRKDNIEACLIELRDLGYHHSTKLTAKQWQAFVDYAGQAILFGKELPVEPHWAFAPNTLALNIDYTTLWQRVVRKSLNGISILSFSAEDEVIILCMHGAKHEWGKLKWVVDLSMFINHHNQLDWHCLMQMAELQGVARIVIFGLSLSKRLSGGSFPSIVLQWMAKDPFAVLESQKLADNYLEAAQCEDRSIYRPCYYHWSMRERFRDKWRYLFRTITQPKVEHFLDIKIPDRLFFLYFPYKLLHDYMALPIWLSFKKIKKVCRR